MKENRIEKDEDEKEDEFYETSDDTDEEDSY